MAVTAAMVKELREMTGAGMMDCVEVVNTTDHDVDLNNEYQFGYAVKEGSRKILNSIMSKRVYSSGCICIWVACMSAIIGMIRKLRKSKTLSFLPD